MPEYAYATLDVFTRERFGGNPLAIVSDARGLSDERMQAIAAEFNYSETTFVLPPEDPNNTARVRIFTGSCELPFAGHPNVGTGFYLGGQGDVFGKPVGSTMRFEEKAGLVEVELLNEGGVVVGASIKAPQSLKTGATIDAATVADCLSLTPGDICMNWHAPTSASVGVPFVMVETDLASLANARPDTNAFVDALSRHGDDNAVGRFSLTRALALASSSCVRGCFRRWAVWWKTRRRAARPPPLARS